MEFLDPKKRKLKENELDVAFFMAIKNVFYKKAMLFMIIGIIGLGFLSTMFSSAIINGLKYTIEEKVITGAIGHVLIQPNQNEDYLTNVGEIEKKVLAIPNVIGVSPRVDSYITIIDKHGTKITAPVRIIDPDKEATATNLYKNILAGKYLSSSSINELLIGAELTKKYRMMPSSEAADIDAGEKIDAIMEYGGHTIYTDMKVRGIYGQEFMFTDGYIYMTEKGVKEIFNVSNADLDIASMISVKARERGDETEIKNKINALGVNGRVWEWCEKLGLLNQFVDSLMIISNLTAVIGVIIAFATIYIMVYINVLQKRSQIGIMKAMGITENTILLSYMIQSLMYGIMGTIFGLLLTRGVLAYIDINPIHMPMGYVKPVTDTIAYLKSSLFLLFSAMIAGYMASEGVIKEKILDAIFKG